MARHRQPAMPFWIDEAKRLFADTADWAHRPRPVTEILDNRSEPYISSCRSPRPGISAQGRRDIVLACFCYLLTTTQLHCRGRETGANEADGPLTGFIILRSKEGCPDESRHAGLHNPPSAVIVGCTASSEGGLALQRMRRRAAVDLNRPRKQTFSISASVTCLRA